MPTARTQDRSLDVSTREIVDVALRSLRAHGATYASARHAADLVEELQVVDSSGLPTLQAALRRRVVTATVHHRVIDAHGSSALLAAPAFGDLLSTSDDATLVNAGEPYAVLGVLRRVVEACGGSWTAEWIGNNADLRGGCYVDSNGAAYRWGEIVIGQPNLPTVTVWARRAANSRAIEMTRAAPLPALAPTLTRARQFGLTVERAQWTAMVREAEKFLLDTPRA